MSRHASDQAVQDQQALKAARSNEGNKRPVCLGMKMEEKDADHDGAGGVDDVAAGLGAGIHKVDGSQQQLLLQVRALPNLRLGLVCLHHTLPT